MDDWGDDDGDEAFTLTQEQLSGIDSLENKALKKSGFHPQSASLGRNVKNTGVSYTFQNNNNVKFKEPYNIDRNNSQFYKPLGTSTKMARVVTTSGRAKVPVASTSLVRSQEPSLPMPAHTRRSHPIQTNVPDMFPQPQSHTNELTRVQAGVNCAANADEEMTELREQLKKYERQLSSITNDKFSYEGQIKMLRDALWQKDQDISRHKQEKQQTLNAESAQRSEREKDLQGQVDKLSSQLQFKEREIVEAQSNYTQLLQRAAIKSPPRLTSTQISHKTAKTGSSPGKRKTDFPTAETFSEDSQPAEEPEIMDTSQRRVYKTSARNRLHQAIKTAPKRQTRQMALPITVPKQLSGAVLVDRILDISGDRTDLVVSMLKTPSMTLDDPPHSQAESSQDKTSLNTNKRASDGSLKSSHATSKLSLGVQYLKEAHCEMARHAIRNLLITPNQHHRLTNYKQSNMDHAVLMLPVMEDSLTLYLKVLEHIQTPQDVLKPTQSSGVIDPTQSHTKAAWKALAPASVKTPSADKSPLCKLTSILCYSLKQCVYFALVIAGHIFKTRIFDYAYFCTKTINRDDL